MITKLNKMNYKHTQTGYLTIFVLIAVALIVLSFVAPTFIVNTLYGNAYLDAVKLLGLFSVGLGLFSFLISFHMI